MTTAVAGPRDLVAHLSASTGLTEGEATRVVGEVVAYFTESLETFVRRRHTELQAEGLTNEQIFGRLSTELAQRLVRPPVLSARQLRRLVYG